MANQASRNDLETCSCRICDAAMYCIFIRMVHKCMTCCQLSPFHGARANLGLLLTCDCGDSHLDLML